LKAIKRIKTVLNFRPDKYKFYGEGEIKINRMDEANLKFGIWKNERSVRERKSERSLEEESYSQNYCPNWIWIEELVT